MPNTADGPWTAILIGHQWPGDTALETLDAGARNRHAVGAAFDSYAESLRSTSRTFLGMQEGVTAHHTREAFASGERHAQRIAEKNSVKKDALRQAHSATTELRSQLSDIAERGTGRIRDILDSKLSHAEQTAHLVDLVTKARTEANLRAAACSQTMLGSIQAVLNESRSDIPARQFAALHGVELDKNYAATDSETIRRDVRAALATPAGSGSDAQRGMPTPGAPAPPRGLPAYGPDLRGPTTTSAAGDRATAHPEPPPGSARTAVLAGALRSRAAGHRSAAPDERLRPILEFVALQEPRLRWSVSDYSDRCVVLATDLAGGWIPPNIAVPVGVQIWEPGGTPDPLTAAAERVTYEPGQYLPPAIERLAAQPVSSGAAVDRLELSLFHATRERERLPHVAHTLMGALCARQSYPRSDVLLLAERIGAVRHSVLESYPAAVDPTDVGNWQLLASVDALLRDEPRQAAYHFGWFQA